MRLESNIWKHAVFLLCVLLFTSHGLNIVLSSQSLDDNRDVDYAGTAVRIEISAPATTLTADEVAMFTAELYDSVNNLVTGDVVWSCSNGSISPEGMFYPWNSGIITIEASHNGIVGSLNITVTAGVGQSLEITSLDAHVLAPVTLHANLLDARGNAQLSLDAVWTVDGDYVGVGSPAWTPEDVGEYSIRARLHQMEHVAVMHVRAGAPYEFIFEEGIARFSVLN